MSDTNDTNAKLDALAASVAELTTGMAALVRGVEELNTTLGTHSEMLTGIMEACSIEEDGAPELHDALVEIAHHLERNNDLLTMIGGNLHNLGGTIQVAVIQGLARAMSGADEDGVVSDEPDGHGHTH
jgi:hypothetical protein